MSNELRVFGPPGTGKTTYLSRQVEQAVDKFGLDGVIIASFTRGAAHEIASRVKELGLGREQVGTLHALCYRALGSPTIAETKAKEFNEWQSIFQLSAEGVDIDEPEQSFVTDGDRLLAAYQLQRARITPRASWPLDVSSFAALWEKWKETEGYIDFTDMIEEAIMRVIPPPVGANGDPPVVGFFDEAQDFTPLELALVRQWATDLDYVVVAGDDDQSIYSFKGSSPDAFLNPPLPDDQKRTLGQSWRMPRKIHNYTQMYITQVARREPKFFLPRPEGGHLETRPNLTYANAGPLVSEACAYAEDGLNSEGNPRTVMLLASCGYQVGAIVRELRRQGQPYHNPYRIKRGDWNPLRGSRGTTTAQRVLALLRPDAAVHGDYARPWTVGDVREWAALFPKTGIAKRGAFKEIDGAPGEQMADAEMCARVFEDGVIDALLTDPLAFLKERASPAKMQVLEFPLAIARKDPRRLMERPKIIVGTIHSVKGGEADSVYLMPDLSRAGMAEYLNGSGHDSAIRMMYVGMSRARDRLVLCGSSTSERVEWPEYK